MPSSELGQITGPVPLAYDVRTTEIVVLDQVEPV